MPLIYSPVDAEIDSECGVSGQIQNAYVYWWYVGETDIFSLRHTQLDNLMPRSKFIFIIYHSWVQVQLSRLK